MGCDGGSIPKRAEMVKIKKKIVKDDSDAQVKFQTCYLSRQELKAPIVSDGLGRLYNREAVLEWLVGEREVELENIKSIKDFTTLKLKLVPTENDSIKSKFMCPITQKEMNGTFKFVYPPCGCVVAELAVQNVKTDNCLVCGKEFGKEILIPIYTSDENELEDLKSKLKLKQDKRKRKSDGKEGAKKKGKTVNIPLPDLSKITRDSTPVLDSIFLKKDEKGNVIDDGNSQNFLVKGTFNRSAASF
jgi:hypothetical protein